MTIADCLRGVIAQRLIRVVPENSRELYDASREECDVLNVDPVQPPKLVRGLASEQNLNTGYFGRTAVFETLEVTPCIRNAINDQQPAYAIREAAEKSGMLSLQGSARELVLSHKTTVEEYSRLIHDIQWKESNMVPDASINSGRTDST